MIKCDNKSKRMLEIVWGNITSRYRLMKQYKNFYPLYRHNFKIDTLGD